MTARRLVMTNRKSDLTPDNCDLKDLAKKYRYRRTEHQKRQLKSALQQNEDLPILLAPPSESE